MNAKILIRISTVISMLFSSIFTPLWAFIWLFFISYLKMLPLEFKIFFISIIVLFTIFIPRLGIDLYVRLHKIRKWKEYTSLHALIPFIIMIISYLLCILFLSHLHTAVFMRSIIMQAMFAEIACLILTPWQKVSFHMVGMGELLGIYTAFSFLFLFDPFWGICIILILSGLVGTSRCILQKNTLVQQLIGFFIGLTSALYFMLETWMG